MNIRSLPINLLKMLNAGGSVLSGHLSGFYLKRVISVSKLPGVRRILNSNPPLAGVCIFVYNGVHEASKRATVGSLDFH